MLENRFQSELIAELRRLFRGCVILKNDPSYLQGFPDLTILYQDKWAVLECKKSASAPVQPNQRHYIDELGKMSYAAFIYPANREEILHELQRAFKIERYARLSESQ